MYEVHVKMNVDDIPEAEEDLPPRDERTEELLELFRKLGLEVNDIDVTHFSITKIKEVNDG